MHRLWDTLIKPIFEIIKPKKIIEIGSEYGTNTKNILEYCSENNSKLISIDPNPQFNIKKFKEKYLNNFDFIKDISLNALREIKEYDLILIDGDHNWYTVYNELKIIETKFNKDNFPIILLHDISWPYGKRDLYYNPDTIPKDFIHPYKKLGICPKKNKLLSEGGLNHDLNNAIEENTPKNGVCTAIEDFLNENEYNLIFKKINAFHGLGIIYRETKITTEQINDIIINSDITKILEEYYLTKIIKKSYETYKLHKINDTKNQDIRENKLNIHELNKKIKIISSERDNLKKQNQEQLNKITNLQKQNQEMKTKNIELNEVKEKLIKINEHNNLLKESNKEVITKNNSLEQQNQEQQNKITNLQKQNQEQKNKITNLQKQTAQLNKTKRNLLKEIDEIQKIKERNIILTNTKIEQNKLNNKQEEELKMISNENIKLKKENIELKSTLKEHERKNKKQNQLLKIMKIKNK